MQNDVCKFLRKSFLSLIRSYWFVSYYVYCLKSKMIGVDKINVNEDSKFYREIVNKCFLY